MISKAKSHCAHAFLSMSLFGAILLLPAVALAFPEINEISPANQHRSGFIEISGTGFGSSGEVTIDGNEAITTTWTDTRIAAYVPEVSTLGAVPVLVVNTDGESSAVNIGVSDREQIGRVQWRLRIDALYSNVRPARDIDGTIYAVDVYDRLYAVAPNGALLWVAQQAGAKGLDVGPDGTIYTLNENWVKAFHPDGTEKWTFTMNPRAFIAFGLGVGPDGHIYVGTSSGMGVFSLEDNGSPRLRWVTPEAYSRPIVTYSELAFGPGFSGDQLYFLANGHVRSLALEDGREIFLLPSYGTPVVSPFDGTVHLGGGLAFDPDGSLLWQFQFPFGGTTSATTAVSENGVSYVTYLASDLYAIDPNGSANWDVPLPAFSGVLGVDPADSLVLLHGDNTLNHVGFIEARNTTNGARLWHLELPTEEPQVDNSWTGRCGFNQYADSLPVFTPGGEAFYLMTAIATGNIVPARGFLYSINTDPSIPAASTILRSSDVTVSAKKRRGDRTIQGQVDVVDESQSNISGATVYVTWTVPDGSTIDQVYTPKGGGGGGKKGGGKRGGGGGSSTASFSIPDAGSGIYTLTVTDVVKDGYSFDSCYSVLSQSVYL